MQLIFASNNKGKLREIQQMLDPRINLRTLADVRVTEEIPEPFNTFSENAQAKASYVYDKTGISCFAEDSGLVVPALNGAPGVFSARYAGMHASDHDNNAKLLANIRGLEKPEAYYQSVICLCLEGAYYFFEGRCTGYLIHEPRGTDGFGYDPLFVHENDDRSFGEISLEEKNKISHRSKSMAGFSSFMNELMAGK
jgi:XTP/dITP diphosphohydrolase